MANLDGEQSFFSTSFVEYSSGIISIRKDVWIFLVVSIVLMVCTMWAAFLFARRLKRRDEVTMKATVEA